MAIVSFTGSTAVGRMIARVAGERLAPRSVSSWAARTRSWCATTPTSMARPPRRLSAYSNAGQRCAAGSRIIVFDSVYEPFKRLLLERTSAQRVGALTRTTSAP